MKNYLVPNVNSAEVEKLRSKRNQGLLINDWAIGLTKSGHINAMGVIFSVFQVLLIFHKSLTSQNNIGC